MSLSDAGADVAILRSLRAHKPTVWLKPVDTIARVRPTLDPITLADIADAVARMNRFRPALRLLFPKSGWDGQVRSPLLDYPKPGFADSRILVKADHALPMTGSIKARGGVYELLCRIERIALDEKLVDVGEDYDALTRHAAAEAFGRRTVAVSSTGNLGFSIGLVARAFGLKAQVHMSRDAKTWKKERLTHLGAEVVEHDCDFTETVARGRSASLASGAEFIDDETSRDLMIGYAMAADEVLAQLRGRLIKPTPANPLIVYLPCGVGGAPGGVTWGLKARLGDAVRCVFVEPVASAGMMVALSGGRFCATSVYDVGLDNNTLADGLAVPRPSQLVLDLVGDQIDAAVALPDTAMVDWVRRAWRDAGLRLEPSAAAALAAVEPFLAAQPHLSSAYQVAWTTGGALLPESEFAP